MAYLPDLRVSETYRVMTDTFFGYDHNLRIPEGAWNDETNLSSNHFPLFSPRGRRGVYAQLEKPQGLLGRDALAYADGETLYYNGQAVEGITLSTEEEKSPKQMVSMGAYLIVFPDGVYVNTQDLTDHGSLGAKYEQESIEISLQPCKIDGTEYDLSEATVSDTAPKSPVNGQYWIDSSGEKHVLKQYSESSEMWVDIPTVYVKIGAAGIGRDFNQLDGVHISGLAYTGTSESMKTQVEELNADNTIRALGDDYIIVVGLIDQAYSYTGSITVERKVPVMDYVCELDNRLWGCRYGLQDGVPVNEIYASALGDAKVWKRFAGEAGDSYAVTVGSDGPFTGMVSLGGFVLAWKEDCVHKIYGTQPSNFKLTTTVCRGVQLGSERSAVVVNERLYYKSRTDICMYDNSLPVSISDALAGQVYSNARAGAMGSKYYINMQDALGGWHLFVYDTERGFWHREDDICALMFSRYKDDLLYIDETTRCIMSASGKNGELEGPVRWEATSGIIGYEYPDSKYLSRFNLRVRMEHGSWCEIYVQYDSDGEWIKQGDMMGTSTQSFTVPVIPRRCDHMQIRIRGEGDVKIYSIAKILEVGSDA